LASNPVAANPALADRMSAGRVSEIVGTVTSVIAEIEQLLAASGVGGALNFTQIEQLTALFSNLAGVAIQAAHDVFGKPVTPDSVLALLPAVTPLVDPPAGASSAA
jgi:hypothetical protein